eukprot:TRINITY_DN539_c0_g1_i4.p1 TRINITY_DN539_c0_g1~~TRINITY_DN539_c0_g1_i4.p1  ORF type:complete len:157 (-),score=41.49 TRINITY_DN539_c0_g1_i4:535-1005(-)
MKKRKIDKIIEKEKLNDEIESTKSKEEIIIEENKEDELDLIFRLIFSYKVRRNYKKVLELCNKYSEMGDLLALAYNSFYENYRKQEYKESIEKFKKYKKQNEKEVVNRRLMGQCFYMIAINYRSWDSVGNNQKALKYFLKAKEMGVKITDYEIGDK